MGAGERDRQLDRSDADKHYEPGNCRWTSSAINSSRRALDRRGAYLGDLRGRLDEAAIANAPIGRLWDGQSLYLNISATGVRSWRWKYHIAGAEKLLTIGRYPTVSIAEARELAAIARSKLAIGRDPASIKAETQARKSRRSRAKLG